MPVLRAACLLTLALSGCATTSNSEWLSSPLDPALHSVETARVASEPAPEARPRLSHTVTLGESYVDAPSASAGLPGAAPPPVQVNVHTQVPVIVNNYAGYGYGYGSYGYVSSPRSSVSSARASSGPPTQVGGNFPAVPDYGPRAMK